MSTNTRSSDVVHFEMKSDQLETFKPYFNPFIEADNTGKIDNQTNLCGETVSKKNGHRNWKLTVDGVVLLENLNLLMKYGELVETVQVNCQYPRIRELNISDLTINTPEDEKTREKKGENSEQLSFSYTLQLKSPETKQIGEQ